MNGQTPWDWCDGYNHEITRHYHGEPEHDGADRVFHSNGWIRLTYTDNDGGCYDYARQLGASKQVAAEFSARCRKRTLDQLENWYSNGWEWFTVRGEYDGYCESVGGIDCLDYAETELRLDVAHEIASQLESAGYTVTNKPQPVDNKLEQFRDKLRRNLTAWGVK